MALTKLTKHIVYGATIVQCRYKDCSDLATSNTSVTTWDSMTLTPQYSDSILEVRFSGSLSSNTDSSAPNQGIYENSKHDLFLDINGSTEYTVENCANTSATDYSYSSSAGRRQGATVAMFHRHLPGTTNLQTITIQVSRANNNGGGNMQGQDGFIVAKEVAGGITTGTPSNNYVN